MTFDKNATQESEWNALVSRDGATTLIDMLTYCRPAGSVTEARFIARFIDSIPGMQSDSFGNRFLTVGSAPAVTLWSSHTDSVHKKDGRQELIRTASHVLMRKDGKDCLGADCATGVWLMREMIHAGVPGLYVFHRDEESGGNGSAHIAKHAPDMLAGIKHAIAFDRKGIESVITHQMGGRCCSDAFAKALGAMLGKKFRPDDTGTFTDTANYTHLIPECTNVSVGYYAQHTKEETQSLPFALRLRDRLIKGDFSTLPCERDPFEDDYTAYSSVSRYTKDLRDLVWANPDAVTEFLEDQGFDIADLEPYLPRRK